MFKCLLRTSFIRTCRTSISCNFITCRQAFLCLMWCQRTPLGDLSLLLRGRSETSVVINTGLDSRPSLKTLCCRSNLIPLWPFHPCAAHNRLTNVGFQVWTIAQHKALPRHKQFWAAGAIISHRRKGSMWIIKAELISFSNLFFYYYSALTLVCFSFCEPHEKLFFSCPQLHC